MSNSCAARGADMYPETPGFQAHSATSKDAAAKLRSAGTLENEIATLLDDYAEGWTGCALTSKLRDMGWEGLQAGTTAARLRGLELAGRAVRTTQTRLTVNKRQANVWMSPRQAKRQQAELAPSPGTANVAEMRQRITKLELQNEQKARALREAGRVFREYQHLHLNKTPPDTRKAARNEDWADFCERESGL